MLTDQDKSDLLALVSGMGDEDSDSRARRMVELNPEAASYVRQVQKLTTYLAPPATVAPEGRLDPATTARIASGAYARYRRRRLWRLVSPAAAAAAIVLAVLGWRHLGVPRGTIEPGEFTVIDSVVVEAAAAEPLRRSGATTPGSTVSAGPREVAIVRSADGSAVFVAPGDSAVFDRHRTVALQSGSVFAQALSPMTIRTDPARVRIASGELLIQLTSSGGECFVYRGTVNIEVGGREHVLSANQGATWMSASGEFKMLKHITPRPAWAQARLLPIDDPAKRR